METGKHILETMVSVMQKLEDEGYNVQFQATADGLVSLKSNKIYQPGEVKVENFYRFEGESNPDDSSIVYAIAAGNEKGTLTDSYGQYSDEYVAGFIKLVEKINKNTEGE
jgi:hypothetical protein